MPLAEMLTGIKAKVVEQNEFRTSWTKDDDLPKLSKMYWEEHAEYEEAKQLCLLGDDPYTFAGEAGDKCYIYLRICDFTDNQPPAEIEADIARTYAECVELGIDVVQATLFKIWRNDIKYPLMISRNGFTFAESQRLSKQQYTLMGGEAAFLMAYMQLADELH